MCNDDIKALLEYFYLGIASNASSIIGDTHISQSQLKHIQKSTV